MGGNIRRRGLLRFFFGNGFRLVSEAHANIVDSSTRSCFRGHYDATYSCFGFSYTLSRPLATFINGSFPKLGDPNIDPKTATSFL